MKKLLFPLHFLILFTSSLIANNAVEVDRISFNSLRDDWVQMEIELSCNGNPSPDAKNPSFVENIKVKVYLAYLRDEATRKYDYYTAEVEIVIMEQHDDRNVYFYLPGPIVERDRLKKEPDFYYAEVSINGELLPPQQSAMSRSIKTPQILESFVSNADSGSVENEHMLMPIYLVSGIDIGRVSNLPVFLRRDVRD